MAFKYFHQLLCMGLVLRNNRKLVAYTCVVLAFKFNEETHLSLSRLRLQMLVRSLCELDRKNSLKPTDIFKYEFEVYRKLRFNLHRDPAEFQEFFNKVFERVEINPEEYGIAQDKLNN